jgi:voltage-gated potassium channel
VLILFGFGTIFYSLVEGWGVLDSLYFSVMTLLTVGYGDLVPTTDASKAFTILYVLVGAGILVGFITLVAREAMGLPPDRDDASRGASAGASSRE